ncbi:DUF6728 family protein [Pontibacter chitinilyticus]|uniref:DUF6728 family protein n=1 Tax=Pontibacter chitinilyticus TaxID=2674989 RepID=UPI003D2B1AEB
MRPYRHKYKLTYIMKGLFDFSEVATYFFRKKDPNRKSTFNLRTMHRINKISMLMFLAGIVYFIIKHI